jgi:hypothetical protein
VFEMMGITRHAVPRWGVVLKEKVTYRFGDETEETIGEGEAYCARPGHVP